MSSNPYSISDSPVLSTFNLNHTTPNGRVFSYTLTRIHRYCYSFEAAHTGKVVQFPNVESFQTFWSALKLRLNELNPVEVKLLPATTAKVAAISAPTTDHLIRIDATAPAAELPKTGSALIDITECLSCHNAILDGDLCPTCTNTQLEIVTTLNPDQKLYDLRNQLKKLFVEKMSNEAFKTRRAELLEEIATLEAAQQARAAIRLEGERYRTTDAALAISQYTRKYGVRPTQMLISKYDHVPADVDTTGIDVARSGAVIPGELHLSAPKPVLTRPARMAKVSAATNPNSEEVIKIDASIDDSSDDEDELLQTSLIGPHKVRNGWYRYTVDGYEFNLVRRTGGAWFLDSYPERLHQADSSAFSGIYLSKSEFEIKVSQFLIRRAFAKGRLVNTPQWLKTETFDDAWCPKCGAIVIPAPANMGTWWIATCKVCAHKSAYLHLNDGAKWVWKRAETAVQS
jgi:hypothetical protein